MIEPPSFNSGKAFCTVNSVPFTLMLNSLSKCADAGVGENNIDSPLHLGDGFVKTIKIGQLGDVSLNPRNVCADCLHGRIEFLVAAARDGDIHAFFDEKFCRSQANPFCSAGDDGGLAFELLGHRSAPLLLNSELSSSDASRVDHLRPRTAWPR